MVSESEVKKWGNSLAVRINSDMAKEMNLEDGSEICVEMKDKQIIISHKGHIERKVNEYKENISYLYRFKNAADKSLKFWINPAMKLFSVSSQFFMSTGDIAHLIIAETKDMAADGASDFDIFSINETGREGIRFSITNAEFNELKQFEELQPYFAVFDENSAN